MMLSRVVLGLVCCGWITAGFADKIITCARPAAAPGTELSFAVPLKAGVLPRVDFLYPTDASVFSLTDENFLMIAMDRAEISRVRIVISAQYDHDLRAFQGQMVTDSGGNQVQIDDGPVTCRVTG